MSRGDLSEAEGRLLAPFCRRSADARAGPRSTMRIDEYELFLSGCAKALMGEAGFTTLSLVSSESGSLLRLVQCHGGANECLQRLGIDLVALMDIDGMPDVP